MEKLVEKKSHTSLGVCLIVYTVLVMLISYVMISVNGKLNGSFTYFIVPLLFIIFAYLLIKLFVSNPAGRIVSILKKINQRDLTSQQIDIKGRTNKEFTELINGINKMLLSLKKVIKDTFVKSQTLASSSEELTASTEEGKAASDEIVQSVQKMADAAKQQANEIKELIEEAQKIKTVILTMIEKNKETGEIGKEAMNAIAEGLRTADMASKQMIIIEQTIKSLATMVDRLNRQSQKISDIIGVINDIASQTQLLSLNASIEAAHAGEQGKGFAVVANEIQRLSAQSTNSASEISRIISGTQKDTGEVVESMSQGIKEVDKGIAAINQNNRSFKKIKSYMDDASHNMKSEMEFIADVSQLLKKSANRYQPLEILAQRTSASAQSISAATEQQSASMEEIARSAISLSQLADEMHQNASSYRV